MKFDLNEARKLAGMNEAIKDRELSEILVALKTAAERASNSTDDKLEENLRVVQQAVKLFSQIMRIRE